MASTAILGSSRPHSAGLLKTLGATLTACRGSVGSTPHTHSLFGPCVPAALERIKEYCVCTQYLKGIEFSLLFVGVSTEEQRGRPFVMGRVGGLVGGNHVK